VRDAVSLPEFVFGLGSVTALLGALVSWGRMEWQEMQQRCLCDEEAEQ
jgi:hypothetical protein